MERKRDYLIPMTEVMEHVDCVVLYQTSIDEGDADEGMPEAHEAIFDNNDWDQPHRTLWDD